MTTHTTHDFQTNKIVFISGGHFIHDVFSSFLPVFLPLLITKFGLSMFLAGTFTLFFRLPSVSNPLIGIISDRINIGYLAIWGPALTALTMSLLSIAPNYPVACILLFIAGISAAVFHVLGPVMIARIAGVHIGTGMSFWMTAGELARTLGPLIAAWAILQWRLEDIYPVMAVGFLASAFLWFHLKDTHLEPEQQTRIRFGTAWTELRHLMIPLTGIIVSRAFMAATLVAFLPTYMVLSGKSLLFGGTALAALECAGTVGSFVGGTISDRVGRQTVLLTAIPLSCVLMLGLAYAPDAILLPVIVLLGFTLFMVTPVNMAIVQDNSKNNRGAANGFYMGINFLATAGVTVFAGWLADMAGLKTAFIVSALLGFVGIPIIFFLPKSCHA